MRAELERIEWIERYLEGKLSPEGNAEFETLLSSDPAFRQEVDTQRQIQHRFERMGLLALIDSKHQALVVAKPGFKWWSLNNILWMAPLTLALIGGAVWYGTSAHTNNDDTSGIKKQPVTTQLIASNETDDLDITPEHNAPERKVEEPVDVNLTASGNAQNAGQSSGNVGQAYITNISRQGTQNPTPDPIPVPNEDEDLVSWDNFQVPFSKKSFDPAHGIYYEHHSGSKIRISPHTVVDENGKLVQGPVVLHYREFRDPADMAFSGINMSMGDHDRMHSAGMFEIYIEKDGKRLALKRDFIVELRKNQECDDMSFFTYKASSKTWEKLGYIEEDAHLNALPRVITRRYVAVETEDDLSSRRKEGPGTIWIRADLDGDGLNENYLIGSNKKALKRLRADEQIMGEKHLYLHPAAVKYGPGIRDWHPFRNDRKFTTWTGHVENWRITDSNFVDVNSFAERLEAEKLRKQGKVWKRSKGKTKGGKSNSGNSRHEAERQLQVKIGEEDMEGKGYKRQNADYYGWGGSISGNQIDDTIPTNEMYENPTASNEWVKAGQEFPEVVKGLKSQGFGVYNCDGVHRINNRVAIEPEFVNEEGEAITNIKMLTVIDGVYNAAYSFSPELFFCDAKGDNRILIFTEEGKLYSLQTPWEEMALQGSGVHQMQMKDISYRVRNTRELRKFLDLKKGPKPISCTSGPVPSVNLANSFAPNTMSSDNRP